MKRTMALFLVLAIVPFQIFAVTPSDPTDFVLVASKLSTTQEGQFNAADGALSAFWSEWQSSSKKLDYIRMVPSSHGWNRSSTGFEGDGDGQLTVKAAWGEKGIYFLYEVSDDQFCDICIQCIDDTNPATPPHCESDPSWMNDAIDMFIDKVATTVLAAFPDLYYINATFCQTTKTMAQIQYRYGNQDAVTSFRLNRYDQATAQMSYASYDFDQAKQNLDGMSFETVKVSDNSKAQEWFIPWSQVGSGGIPVPTVGKKIAYTAGYNDADGGADQYDALRWKNRGDPFKRERPDSARACTPLGDGRYTCNWNHVPVDAWGDLEFGEVIPNISVKMPLRAAGISAKEITRTDYFTVEGRMIPVNNGRIAVTDNTLVIERGLTRDGRRVTSRCVVANGMLVSRSVVSR